MNHAHEEQGMFYHLGSLGAVVVFSGGAFLIVVATARTLIGWLR